MLRPFQIVRLLVSGSILLLSAVTYPQAQSPAAVTFTLDFPTSQPERYSIRVPSDGSAHYQSSGRLSADSDETDSRDKAPTTSASPPVLEKGTHSDAAKAICMAQKPPGNSISLAHVMIKFL